MGGGVFRQFLDEDGAGRDAFGVKQSEGNRPLNSADAFRAAERRADPEPAVACRGSIIIPTFNARATLRECVASIEQQTFSDFEILLIDGASTDGTLALIQEIGATYRNIRWRSEPDAGVYDAMNKGIRLARGQWLYFLGADDWLRDASVFENMEPHLNGTADLVYGDVVLENDPWGREGMVYGREF